MNHHRRIVFAVVLCLAFSVFGMLEETRAQDPLSDRELFDFPESSDLYCAYHPSSSQAVALAPAGNVASMLLTQPPFDEVHAGLIASQEWNTPDFLELFPGETLVLRTAAGTLYKLSLTSSPQEDAPQIHLQYALLSDEAPSQTHTTALTYYEALDLDTGDTFVDPSVASVIFCDFGPVVTTPTPTTPIPEPGSALLVLLGLLGLYGAWKLARRKGKRSLGMWLLLLLSMSLVISFGAELLTAQQQLSCTLTVERGGSGDGTVRGGAIDCGETCSVSYGNGELLNLKAIPEAGSAFSGWLVNGEPYSGLFQMQGETVLTALFDPIPNETPLARNDFYRTDEDVALQIEASGVLHNDSDPNGDELQAILQQAPSHGSLTLNPDGSFNYLPDEHFYGIDQFLYRVSDGDLESAVAVVTISVNAVENPPTADDLNIETVKNRPEQIELSGGDPDGDPITYQIIDGPANGSLSGTDNHITYTPNPDFTGSDSFTYLVNDETSDSNLATVTIFVRDIDLAIGSIDVSNTVLDEHTLTLSGSVSVEIRNTGAEEISGPYQLQVFALDSQNDNTRLELGRFDISATLTAGETTSVEVNVNGAILFKDNPIYAFVDSANVIKESNEENNISHNLVNCEMEPAEPGSFNPVLEWEWTGSDVMPEWNQVISAPVVANLNDDNEDGMINTDDIPDIIFNTYPDPNPQYSNPTYGNGVLRAISGDGSGELFTITEFRTAPANNIAVGDIDGDGFVEICVSESGGGRILSFNHDGTLLWAANDDPNSNEYLSTIILADIDEDQAPEVLYQNMVLNGKDGSVKWIANTYGHAIVANLDLMGNSEVIIGNTAYFANGDIYWKNSSISGGFSAVGNFDNDPYPEISLVSNKTLYLLSHDGVIIWQTSLPNAVHGGPPTIADVDNDDAPEIGIAAGPYYVVIETNGTKKWTRPTQDLRSGVTGSSVFDFNGDGSVEVVYADEKFLYIYQGEDGDILFQQAVGSGTLLELPLIADVDNDHNAEIIVGSGLMYGGPKNGIQVFGDANDSWVNTRKIWNQHSYHVTNVNDDGTIPQVEANSWETHNTYRCNLIENALACEDYSASYLRVDNANAPASVELTARIGNSGIIDAAVLLNVAFYNGDPQDGGTLLGVTTTASKLNSGEYEDVSIAWENPPEILTTLYAVVDDDGTGKGQIRESKETNNTAQTTAFLGIPPVADAGPDQRVSFGIPVVLDGSASNAPDDHLPLTYLWTLVEQPVDSAVDLNQLTPVAPTFTPDQPGLYRISLFVENSLAVRSNTDSVIISVRAPGEPVAEDVSLSTFQNVPVMIELQGHDDDGDPLTYTIVGLPQHGTIRYSGDDLLYTPESDYLGEETFTYQANDGSMLSDPATVSISVLEPVAKPIANAGPDRKVYIDDLVTLEGLWSEDSDGKPLTYQWSLLTAPQGSSAVLSAEDGSEVTFTADVRGEYRIGLTVHNGEVASELDVVTITAIPAIEAHNDTCTVDPGSQNTVCDVLSNDSTYALDVPPFGNMLLWLKADAIQGVEDGEPVVLWEDHTYHHHDAFSSNYGPAPLFESEIHDNGKSSLVFDSQKSARLILPAQMSKENFAVFVVLQTDEEHTIEQEYTGGYNHSATKRYVLFGDWRYAEVDGRYIGISSGLSVGTNGITVLEHGSYLMAPVAVSDRPVGHDFNIVSYQVKANCPIIYLNGEHQRIGLVSGHTVHTPIAIGALSHYARFAFTGYISEIIMYKGVLSDEERLRVNQYLGWKYTLPLQNSVLYRFHRSTIPLVVERPLRLTGNRYPLSRQQAMWASIRLHIPLLPQMDRPPLPPSLSM